MAEATETEAVGDNPIAAALGRRRGARLAAMLCALLLVCDLVAVYRAGEDAASVRTGPRAYASRTGLRGADASPSLPELPPALDPTLPASDPLPAALASRAST